MSDPNDLKEAIDAAGEFAEGEHPEKDHPVTIGS